MANVLKIEYLYRDKGGINDFLLATNSTDVKVDWNVEESFIKITWTWGQESQVDELLDIISKSFKIPNIASNTEEYFVETKDEETSHSEDIDTKIQEVFDNASEEENEEPESEEEVVIEEISSTPLEPIEKIELHEENKEESELPKKSEELEKEIEKEEVESYQSAHEIIKTVPVIKIVEEPETSDEEYIEAMKNLLGESFENYNFESDIEKVTRIFCRDFDIKSSIIMDAIALSTFIDDDKKIVQTIARNNYINPALVSGKLNKDFRSWLESNYPDFIQKYPNIKITHFLNLFKGKA